MNLCINAFAVNYAHMHASGMRHDIPRLLRKMMDAGPFNQVKLAKRIQRGAVKVSQPDISRWLKGAEPEVPKYERIIAVAEEMGILSDLRSEDVAATLPGPARRKTVKLIGYVGAGSSRGGFCRPVDQNQNIRLCIFMLDSICVLA